MATEVNKHARCGRSVMWPYATAPSVRGFRRPVTAE